MIHVSNEEISKILSQVSDLLELKNEEWKPRAYRNASRVISSWEESLRDVYEREGEKGLKKIPNVGEHISQKIIEILETGKLKYLSELKKEIPIKIDELMKVEGMGPKRILLLHKTIRIKDLKTLEAAAREGKIAKLPGMGKKTEENLLRAISFVKKSGRRKLLHYAMYLSEEIISELRKNKEIEKIQVCGSLARRVETIGDIDLLVVTKNPKEVMGQFTKMKHVSEILAKGETKSSVIYDDMQVDLRVVPPKSFGSATQYFVGSKEHNVALRKIAMSKGYKLNEYGLFKKEKLEEGQNEKEIYRKLGLDWVPFELRENRGEIEAAKEKSLPHLVKEKDILGDTHMHTVYSDGANTVEDMVKSSLELGHKYIIISDHVGYINVTNSMSENKIKKQGKEINMLNKKYRNIKILHGAEVDIKLDGNLSVPNRTLKRFDVVLGAIHTGLRRRKEEQTKRILKAMDKADIIAHPTGRLLSKRAGYELDFGRIFEKAKKTNTIFEINAFPDRLDLKDTYIREAIENDVKLSIGTDAHETRHLKYLKLGVYNARRGWCERKNIINTFDFNKIRKLFEK